MVYSSVINDTVYTTSAETLEYKIKSPSSVTIINGTSHIKPDGSPIEIYVNRLVEPFLGNGLNPTATGTTTTDAMRTFYLYGVDSGGTETLLETYIFLRCYDPALTISNSMVISDPIRKNIPPQVTIPFSVALRSSASINLQY